MAQEHSGSGPGRLRLLAQAVSVLLLLAGLSAYIRLQAVKRQAPQLPATEPAREHRQVVSTIAAPVPVPAPPPTPVEPTVVTAPPAPPPPPAPRIDRAALAGAEAVLDAASRDRARAEARAAELARQLESASNQAALDAAKARKLAFRIKDPSAQINRTVARGGFIRADIRKLGTELTALRAAPRPRAVSILSKSPVARPTSTEEFHFELRRNRISYINLERLLELAKADAQVRIRMSDRTGLIASQVGPVGSFSLGYILGRAGAGIEELIERQSIRYDLKGWELVPEEEQRGESYEATRNPISRYVQALNRLSAERSVVTFWVYPDSFTLYRQLREELTARGFSVAGRPLPEGMRIRGSPMGSVSAAQ